MSTDCAPGCGPPAAAVAAVWHALVPALAGAPRMRVSRDGGRTYPRRYEQRLAAVNPGQAVTVPVYDAEAGTGRLLAADFDVGRARAAGAADPAGVVAAEAAGFAALVGSLGGRCITDVSPGGGRHVYVLFAAALPWRELRDAARALAVRYVSLDPAPMAGPGGQISPPGARHRSGGWRAPGMPLEEAVAAVQSPCGPRVWAGLLAGLAAELAAVEPVTEPGEMPPGAVLDEAGIPWLPRLGGRVPLSPALAGVARTGTWPRGRYAGRSQARMAVITAAAAAGWRLAEVRAALADGTWAGLAALYARPREPRRLERLLPAEWRKSVARLAGKENPRSWHTSGGTSRPPAPGRSPASNSNSDDRSAKYGGIRMWLTAADCAAADPGRVAGWGGAAIGIRLVLAALGQAAMVSGSMVIEFGVRNLALQAGVSYRTAARALAILREEDDPLVDLVSAHRLKRADRYQVRIPAAYAEQARWRRRRAGRVEAIHPVFGVLGGAAALAYAALGPDQAPAAEVARAARLSDSGTAAALKVLAEHGLAEHGPRGWRRGPADPGQVADTIGATRQHKERQAAYAADRAAWQALIGSWLAPPAIPARADPGPHLPIDDVLAALEPPAWLTGDPGPPARPVPAVTGCW